MKVVILAGGLPSIIGEESGRIPKPMAQIGERPILWHIMKLFSHYGHDDFIICAGYRSQTIKEYFLNYYVYRSDITVHLKTNEVEIHNHLTESWQVSIVDTGLRATTAERLYKISSMLEDEFIVVYGDCISDINADKLVASHRKSGKQMTLVLARPTGRNKIMPLDAEGRLDDKRAWHGETGAWANACIMVVSPAIFQDRINPGERFEEETVMRLARRDELNTYCHDGFWLPVETVRDRDYMQAIWDSGKIPWKQWDD